MSTLYSIGQMNQLGDALEVAGFSVGDVTKLRSFADLAAIKSVVEGLAKIVVVKHVIDCDADPFLPEGWSVKSHKKDGKFEWNPANVQLYLSPNQQKDKRIEGNKLRKELAQESVFNANVLDYLLAHSELIPEEWKGRAVVFFWGTIYRHSDGDLCVRALYWSGSSWHWNYYWLGHDWGCGVPALLRASSN